MLRKLIKETTTKHDWDYFVHILAMKMEDPDTDTWDLASEVFRPSPDEEVRAMRNIAHENLPELRAAVQKEATSSGHDFDMLMQTFLETLDSTEEYMTDEEDEETSVVDGTVGAAYLDSTDPLLSFDQMFEGDDPDTVEFRDSFLEYARQQGIDPQTAFFMVKVGLVIVAPDNTLDSEPIAMWLASTDRWSSYDPTAQLPQ